MPRKGEVAKREIPGDPVFNSTVVQRLINKILRDGKKSLAERIVYSALMIIEERAKQNPLDVMTKAITAVRPTVEVKPRRVGGSTYQVPVEPSTRRAVTLAIRWIVDAARARGERRMAERLAGELMDAANGEGAAVRRRTEIYRMAEANKAYSHYRW
ncbi:MAG TPA: 30S ribosomal protein S7 [Armatimonadetes bacterium]|nr:30S ribosomal protein S7 [Armatimonadota bacterium]